MSGSVLLTFDAWKKSEGLAQKIGDPQVLKLWLLCTDKIFFLKIVAFEYQILCAEIWLKFEYLGQFIILSFKLRANVRSCCRVADAITGARDIYIRTRANAAVHASKLEPQRTIYMIFNVAFNDF